MKLACIAFTPEGRNLALNIQQRFDGKVDLYSKENYKESLPLIFEQYDGLVFLSSTGIAVRLSAPFLKDKNTDPAIVVVDDLARYAISLVSGHLGGANELTESLATLLKCQPIITTASDGRGIEAIDLFAQKHNLVIGDMNDAKIITAMMLEGKKIQILLESGEGYESLSPNDKEKGLRIQYPYLVEEHPEGCVFITSATRVECKLPSVLLHPKILNLGVGCRKGKTKDELFNAIVSVFGTHHLSLKSVKRLATLELKIQEPGIQKICQEQGWELKGFSNAEIEAVQVQFEQSAWVQASVGVTGVCEPCCYLAGGTLIVNKTAINGITVSVSRERIYG
ncbi:cobalt-precorrin 5A hydrolase [Deltaproteobacteria bacterium TL4]